MPLDCNRNLHDSYYKIDYLQVQLAMRQYLSGIDIGFPLGAFQHLEVCQDHESPWKTFLSSVDAHIVSQELLVRFQTWTLVPWNRSNTFAEQLEKDRFKHGICIHNDVEGSFYESPITDVMIS